MKWKTLVWWHWLTMVVPISAAKSDIGMLFIGGGSRNSEQPKEPEFT